MTQRLYLSSGYAFEGARINITSYGRASIFAFEFITHLLFQRQKIISRLIPNSGHYKWCRIHDRMPGLWVWIINLYMFLKLAKMQLS